MNKYGQRCLIRKANPYKKIGKAIKIHAVGNKVNREFCVGKPGKVLLTYIYYGFVKCAYMSTVKYGCTRQIPSYVLGESLELPIVTDTIHILIANKAYTISKDAYLHSDQGINYTSTKFNKRKGFIQSMSRKGNCWDNVPQKSFLGHMKHELNLSYCEIFEQLRHEIDEYMKYYNDERYQWILMKITPIEYYKYFTTGIMHYLKVHLETLSRWTAFFIVYLPKGTVHPFNLLISYILY
jgi:transposase InsO family protein